MKKLFFALILIIAFTTTVFGQCYKPLNDISLYTIETEEINLEGKTYTHLYFDAKRTATGLGSLKIEEEVNGTWTKIFDSSLKTSFNSYNCPINPKATGIRFYTTSGATLYKTIQNIKLKYNPTITISPYISFGGIEKNASKPINEKLSYYGFTGNIQLGIGALGSSKAGAFSINKTTINADCKDTSEEITITFNPTETGVYTEKLILSNGETVTLYGECSKNMEKTDILEVKRISYASVRLGWEPIEGATGYRIVNTTTGMSYFAEADDTNYNVTGLKMGNTYKFVVHAMYNGATSLNHSNEVEATTKVKEGVVIEDCIAYSSSGKKSMTMGVNQEINYDIKSNNNLYYQTTYKVKFTAWKMLGGVTGYPDLYMLVKLDGKDHFESTKYWKAAEAGITSDPKEFEAMIPSNTVAIKFASGVANGTLDRYIENFTVYKEPVLTSDVNTLDFGEVALGESKTMKLNLTYMNATQLEATEDSRFIEITKFNPTASCTQGTQEIEITFTPTDCKSDYTASLSIFNGQELAITLKGTLKKNDETVKHIIWNGSVSTDWDNRDNWQKTDGTRLTCADVLSEDLTVIIPGGLTQYPVIPDVSTQDKFFTERNDTWNGTQVNAGDNATATKIAHKIVLEQGASIVGVETLYNPSTGVRRYHEVENQFDARRQDWLLVGTVVKPWDESGNGAVRNILSKDYFLGHFPQVYMHEAVIDQENHVTWQQSFTDLNKEVPKNKAFAIYVANEYGAYYYPAETFDYYNGTSYAATLAHPHRYTFTGHFYNESSVITYDNLTPNQPVLLCNTYPAAIDAYALNNAVNGTIEYYDYTTSKSFTDANKEGAVILPQNGFVFTPGDGVTSLTIGAEYMITGGTVSRSTIATPTSCRIKASNAAQAVSSEISIQYDQEKEDVANFSLDAPKLFAKETYGLPDVYVIRHNANWADITIPNMTEPIPLGVTINGSNQTFTLEMTQNNMPYTFVLEDRTTSTMYNLSNGEVCTVSGLKKGDYKGRFYLHATPIQTEDDNQLTNIDEELTQNNNIDIFVQEGTVIVSATQDAQLQSIVVSDMVGRSTTYTVNDQYAEISLPKSKGIYIINVVGEAGITTKKVRL